MKVALQRLFSSLFCEPCIILGLRYYRGLPRYYCRSCTWYYRNHHGSNFFTTAGRAVLMPCVRYFRPGSTTAMTRGTTTPSQAGGGQERAGGVPTPPYPFNSFPHVASLSPAQERRRRTSPDLRLRPLSSHSVRWDRSPPRPLAMEQGFSPNPSLSSLLSCL